MNQKGLRRYLSALVFLSVFTFSTVVQAVPLPMFAARPQDDRQKLPPVNWIRSRKIDTKHIALDL
jgi:hypothetical protein